MIKLIRVLAHFDALFYSLNVSYKACCTTFASNLQALYADIDFLTSFIKLSILGFSYDPNGKCDSIKNHNIIWMCCGMTIKDLKNKIM